MARRRHVLLKRVKENRVGLRPPAGFQDLRLRLPITEKQDITLLGNSLSEKGVKAI
jgi:hypothetical protein